MKNEFSEFTRGADRLRISLLPAGDAGLILVHTNGRLSSHGVYCVEDAGGVYDRLISFAQTQGWEWNSALAIVKNNPAKSARAELTG